MTYITKKKTLKQIIDGEETMKGAAQKNGVTVQAIRYWFKTAGLNPCDFTGAVKANGETKIKKEIIIDDVIQHPISTVKDRAERFGVADRTMLKYLKDYNIIFNHKTRIWEMKNDEE